jgi:hypothetical protein
LCTENEFTWSDEFETAFQTIKASLVSAATLSYFDLAKPTHLCTDASRQGLGFVLQQQTGDTWSLIQAGFLSDAGTQYAIIELELLAVSWAISKCHIFLARLPHITVLDDHHPLVPILNNHRLDEIDNPRLQRLKTKTMGYNFTTKWLKGALNYVPDALSRNPTSDPQSHEMLAERDIDSAISTSSAEIRAMTDTSHESLRLQDLRKIAEDDPQYQQLKQYIIHGFPEHRHQLPTDCR